MNKGLVGLGPGYLARTTSPSPPDRKELGLVFELSDLAAGLGKGKMKEKLEEEEDGKGQDLWPVPIDTSLRIGDPTNIDGLFSDQSLSDATRTRPTGNAENFFGLMSTRTMPTQLHSAGSGPIAANQQAQAAGQSQSQSQKYSPHPPFRFGVEFWGLDTLKEKVRLHSHTVWYAGSLWNVYTQAVRKKGGLGVQVGVYLHRQSSVDPLPGVSAPWQDQQHQSTSGMIVSPIPIPLSSSVMIQSSARAPGAMSPSTNASASAGASANNGRGRAQSEGGSRLSRSRSRSAIWRTTTPVLIAPRLSSPSTVSVLAHPTSRITSPSSISVIATANPSGPSSGGLRRA